jgi:hypothetical protein
MVTQQFERDEPERSRLHAQYNEVQQSLMPMKTS